MKKAQNKTYNLLFIVMLLLLITGCADVSPMARLCVNGDSYGFFGGLWHGMIVPISFIGSLLFDDIAIYAYNNNGAWYDFGFVIGLGALGGGGGKAHKTYYKW